MTRAKILTASLLLAVCGCEGKTLNNPVAKTTGSSPVSAAPSEQLTTAKAPEAAIAPFEAPSLPGITAPSEQLTATLNLAYDARGEHYEARTEHKKEGRAIYVNRLIQQTSPYLLQHAHNPVNWYPWGEEAFAHAEKLGRPVLLSVGYSTCHWCHVMERESFEDEEIAAFINANFIPIKVDREERPDIDDVYMKAVNLLAGRGGWPMTVVMTPQKEPFFGGTYFPPRDGARGARKGFLTILTELSARYESSPAEVLEDAKNLSARMAKMTRPVPPGDVPGGAALRSAALMLGKRFDTTHAGFGRAPKFPTPANLSFLLRYWNRTRDAQALRMVTQTLASMAAGGMYDQVGGGFHRYSVDERWLVPHFEKMLYDNAQLAPLYMSAYQITGEQRFARTARDILTYVAREMTAEHGGFYSATDADSAREDGELEEGYFFTWTLPELQAALSAQDEEVVRAWSAVSERGNFEGRTILHQAKSLDEVAAQLGITPEQGRARFERARHKLREARRERAAPLLDDKILASWNGLMISAFAQGAIVFDEPQYASSAEAAARFVLEEMRDERGRLSRASRGGKRSSAAFLDDYAFMIQGLLDLFEATGSSQWLEHAIALQEVQDTYYLDAQKGGYFMSASDGEELLVREKPAYDGAEPSGNAVAAMNLVRLHALTLQEAWKTRAERLFAAFSQRMTAHGIGSPKMLEALDFYLETTREVILVAPDKDALSTSPLARVLRETYLPNAVVVRLTTEPAALVPYASGKTPLKGKARAFVCEQGRCELPTQDPEVFATQLDKRTPLIQGQALPSLLLGP